MNSVSVSIQSSPGISFPARWRGDRMPNPPRSLSLSGVICPDSQYPEMDRHPRSFFATTYFNQELSALFHEVSRGLQGQIDDRIVELDSPLASGKTHTLLSLYHWVKNGQDLQQIPQVDRFRFPETVRVAAFSGDINIRQGIAVENHCPIFTPWGLLGWQLDGESGYALMETAADEWLAPSQATLKKLLAPQPTLILIDDFLAYVEQAIALAETDSNFALQLQVFLDNLTAVVRELPQAMLVYAGLLRDVELVINRSGIAAKVSPKPAVGSAKVKSRLRGDRRPSHFFYPDEISLTTSPKKNRNSPVRHLIKSLELSLSPRNKPPSKSWQFAPQPREKLPVSPSFSFREQMERQTARFRWKGQTKLRQRIGKINPIYPPILPQCIPGIRLQIVTSLACAKILQTGEMKAKVIPKENWKKSRQKCQVSGRPTTQPLNLKNPLTLESICVNKYAELPGEFGGGDGCSARVLLPGCCVANQTLPFAKPITIEETTKHKWGGNERKAVVVRVVMFGINRSPSGGVVDRATKPRKTLCLIRICENRTLAGTKRIKNSQIARSHSHGKSPGTGSRPSHISLCHSPMESGGSLADFNRR